MTIATLEDCTLWLDEHDLTSDTNQADITDEFDVKDSTTFGSGGKRARLAGLESFGAECKGFLNTSGSEPAWAGTRGNALVSTMTIDGTTNTVAYMGRYLNAKFVQNATLGEIARIDGTLTSSQGSLIKGELLVPKAARTTSSNSTARQITDVAAGESVYGALHIFAVSGTTPTLDVVVASDDGAGFGSGTTRLTFPQANAVGSSWQSAAGAITDDYWRVAWTVGGTDPSFTFAVAVGIR